MSRTWGYWTRRKLDVLRKYLDQFAIASKRSPERIYIDAFAGEPENQDRDTGLPIQGSASIALSAGDPGFSKLRFFETASKAPRLETMLRSQHPGRDIKVIGGDCNETIPLALDQLRASNWAPTFAFVDPNGMEARWETLAALAAFRPSHLTKCELFLLFAAPMFTRVLRVDGSEVRPEDAEAIDGLFGCDDWRHIYRARLAGELSPALAREEYLNLMRWRVEQVLGYRWTHPLEIRNVGGVPIYYMIFATDHDAGNRIMTSIYAQAAAEFPAMREDARRLRRQKREEEQGVHSLFGEDDQLLREAAQPGERFYEHESPKRPWFLSQE